MVMKYVHVTVIIDFSQGLLLPTSLSPQKPTPKLLPTTQIPSVVPSQETSSIMTNDYTV